MENTSKKDAKPEKGEETKKATPEKTAKSTKGAKTAKTAKTAKSAETKTGKKPAKTAKAKKKKQKKVKTVLGLLMVPFAAILAAAIFLPVLQIASNTMEPTLSNGDVVILYKANEYETGQIIAFTKNGKTLVKRVIGTPGDTVDIDDNGSVYVNGALLDEPYLDEKALGDCDISFPYTVPSDSYFVLADNRAESVDSRSELIESVNTDKITGRVLLRLWPFGSPSVE